MTPKDKLALAALILLFVIVGVSKIVNLDWQQVYRFDFSDQELKQIIDQNLQGQEGDFAIVLKRLGQGEVDFSLGEDKVLPAASLYKLVVMAATFESIKSGKLSMDDEVSSTKLHLDQVLSDEGSSYPGAPSVIGYKVSEALDRIARISDNYAAIMLLEKLRADGGDDPIQKMADQLGMRHTNFSGEHTVTSAGDISLFFDKLHKGEVVSKEASEQIITLLARGQINDRIPAQLPPGIRVAHKTGELPYLRHDAGIVFLEGKPYIIVLMSSKLKFEDRGVELLAKISKEVYNYYSKGL